MRKAVYNLLNNNLKKVDRELVVENRNRKYKVIHVSDFDLDFCVNILDRTIPDSMQYSKRVFAYDEMQFVLKYVNERFEEGDFFLDCGANIGTTSVYFSKALDNSRIISFEPVKENFKLLKANCALNNCSNIIVENLGLGSENTTSSISIWETNYGSSSIIEDASDYYGKKALIEECELIRLDNYIDNHSIQPEKIKCIWIDTEGYELEVLKGAFSILENSNASVYMEYNYKVYCENNQIDEIISMLEKYFCFYIVYEDYCKNIKERKLIKTLREVQDFCNILLFKD